jgi:hypothetical protein
MVTRMIYPDKQGCAIDKKVYQSKRSQIYLFTCSEVSCYINTLSLNYFVPTYEIPLIQLPKIKIQRLTSTAKNAMLEELNSNHLSRDTTR